MHCLHEDEITDLAAGRVRLEAGGMESHLAACASCAALLAAAVQDFDARLAAAGKAAVATIVEAERPEEGPRRDSALHPGTVLNDTYTVKRLIGSGGMGEVYEVDHVRLAGRYAVKVLRAEIAGDEQLLARFEREAEITSALWHPHIVQVIDFNRTADRCVFLAMEYLEGSDLAVVLAREKALPLSRAMRLVGQVVSALSAAHRRGIVHRDLKPANIFVLRDEDGSERVKLMDFGLSKWAERSLEQSLSLSRDQALIGTPRYMAPEQARGKNRDVTPATDQFALGAIVYEVLSGVPAFQGETLAEVLHAILYQAPPDLHRRRAEIPSSVSAVLRRAMAKEPERRFPSIQEFFEALELGAADATRHRRRLTVGTVSLVGVLGAGVGVTAWLARDGEPPPPQPGVATDRVNAPAVLQSETDAAASQVVTVTTDAGTPLSRANVSAKSAPKLDKRASRPKPSRAPVEPAPPAGEPLRPAPVAAAAEEPRPGAAAQLPQEGGRAAPVVTGPPADAGGAPRAPDDLIETL